MLRRIAEIRRVHLARSICVLRREDDLAVFRPEQVADAIVALEELPRAARGERRVPDVQMIATRCTPPAAAGARLVRRSAVSLRGTTWRRFHLQVVETFAVRQRTEVPLGRVGGGRTTVAVVTEGVVASSQWSLRQLGNRFAGRVPDLLERTEVLILDEIGERLLHRRHAQVRTVRRRIRSE